MGKLALLLVAASMVGGVVVLSQSDQTSVESVNRLGERQEEIIAREIARSGYNYMRAHAKSVERSTTLDIDAFVKQVNGGSAKSWHKGALQGGEYETQITPMGTSSYTVTSIGRYGDAEVRIGSTLLASGLLVTVQPTKLNFKFVESKAGYCSGVYLQQTPPGWVEGQPLPEPEIIFTASKNRDGFEGDYTKSIPPGTQVNFFLVVDQNCSNRSMSDEEQRALPMTSSTYDYYYSALEYDSASGEMKTGARAMVTHSKADPNVYRVAFEDIKKFSVEQHNDIKRNGYGSHGWKKVDNVWTYGGNGWAKDAATGFVRTGNTSKWPDFSDQVFDVTMITPDNPLYHDDRYADHSGGEYRRTAADDGNNGHGNDAAATTAATQATDSGKK